MTTQVILDVDGGVDDLFAVGWMLVQKRYPQFNLRFVINTCGSVSAQESANRVSSLLEHTKCASVDVVVGEAAPVSMAPLDLVRLWHEPDWAPDSRYRQHSDLLAYFASFLDTLLPTDKFVYVALGPLTSLSKLLNSQNSQICDKILFHLSEVVCMGGTHLRGSLGPGLEYNFTQDPEAVNRSLERLHGKVPVKLCLSETCKSVPFTKGWGNPNESSVLSFLYRRLDSYASAELTAYGHFHIYDLVTLLYALDSSLASRSKGAYLTMVESSEPLFFGRGSVRLLANDWEKAASNVPGHAQLVDELKVIPRSEWDVYLRERGNRLLPDNVIIAQALDIPRVKEIIAEAFQNR